MENYSIQHTVLKSTVGEFSARPVVKTGALTSAEGPGSVPGGELRSHISTDKPRGTAKKKKKKNPTVKFCTKYLGHREKYMLLKGEDLTYIIP